MGLAHQCQDREWPQVKACFSLGRVTGGNPVCPAAECMEQKAPQPCSAWKGPVPKTSRSVLRADAQPGSQDEDREAKRGVRPGGRASSPSPKMVWPGTFMEGAPGPCWTRAPLLVRTGGGPGQPPGAILPAFLWDHT